MRLPAVPGIFIRSSIARLPTDAAYRASARSGRSFALNSGIRAGLISRAQTGPGLLSRGSA
jgi:hypothetical protein